MVTIRVILVNSETKYYTWNFKDIPFEIKVKSNRYGKKFPQFLTKYSKEKLHFSYIINKFKI